MNRQPCRLKHKAMHWAAPQPCQGCRCASRCSAKLHDGSAETEARLQQQHVEQVRAQTQGVASVSAALKLGEEDAAAAARLREELQKAWAALKVSQDKVAQPSLHLDLSIPRCPSAAVTSLYGVPCTQENNSGASCIANAQEVRPDAPKTTRPHALERLDVHRQ